MSDRTGRRIVGRPEAGRDGAADPGHSDRHWRRQRAAAFVAASLLWAWLSVDVVAEEASPRGGLLTLINGDTLAGAAIPGYGGETIRWQGRHFVDPFEFRLGSVRSIKYPSMPAQEDRNEPFSFELTTGDVIVGKLVAWSDQTIGIRNEAIGTIGIRPDLLRRMHRIDEAASVTFSSLKGMDGWHDLSPEDPSIGQPGWQADGDQLVTNRKGTQIEADLSVPSRAMLDLELSWDGSPDFVVALAVPLESDGDP
ncbi:MAG: hypothetical protein JJ992_00255, partial [Planctomycetes bacterium]|nr:hypothetical protein [Planctomycetota bacterium]